MTNVNTTYSSAMDIQIPYNIERVFYYLSGQQTGVVREVMESFESGKRTVIPPAILENSNYITTMRVTSEDTLTAMQQTWKEHAYLLCPHTAVGMRALNATSEKLPWKCREKVLIATATPAKFPEIISQIGLPVPSVPAIDRLFTLPETKLLLEKGQNWEEKLKEVVTSFC